jgi:polar amino acid transport system substrate-binding protein
MRSLLRYIAVGLVATLLTGLGARAQESNALDQIIKRGTVTIGIDLGAPPYGYLDDNKQPTGSDVETAGLLAKDLGVALKIEPYHERKPQSPTYSPTALTW